MDKKRPVIGYCKLKDREAFLAWLEKEGWRRKYSFGSGGLLGGWFDDNWRSYFYKKQELFSGGRVINIFKDAVTESRKSRTEDFLALLDYLSTTEQKLEVFYADDFAALAGYNDIEYVLPSSHLSIEYLKDYSHLPLSQLRRISQAAGPLSAPAIYGDVSVSDMKHNLLTNEKELQLLAGDMEDIKEGKTAELRKLQEEIDRQVAELEKKKQAMMEVLKQKEEELARKKAEMEKQLFFLETQIYGIRCYLGETISLHQICRGKNAPVEAPVILYQKIRFLDEELGKAAAIYHIDGTDTDTFMELLKHREDIREIFVPSPKCISLIRITKGGTHIRQSSNIENMLERYETYHGSQLGVMIRNGENLYISFLDAEKISVSDGYAFFANKAETSNLEESPVSSSSSKDEIASRYFLYALLQGILDHSSVLALPEHASVLDQYSPYIQYSFADGWLTDTRYGNFSDMLARVRELPLKKGDMVLTTMHITRDDDRSTREMKYNNNRGIGEKNRTHDAHISSLRIYPINKVVRSAQFKVDIREYEVKVEQKKIPLSETSWTYKTLSTEITDHVLDSYSRTYTVSELDHYLDLSSKDRGKHLLDDLDRSAGRSSGTIQESGFISDERHYILDYTAVEDLGDSYQYYISVVKRDSARWKESNARANLEIMPEEVIPLTYLNSEWIRYVLVTKNVGPWRVGGECLTYADALIFLNMMLEYLTEREKTEYQLLEDAGLSEWLSSHADWMVTLCEWRMEKQIRQLTPSKASAFAKYVNGMYDID